MKIVCCYTTGESKNNDDQDRIQLSCDSLIRLRPLAILVLNLDDLTELKLAVDVWSWMTMLSEHAPRSA